MPFSSYGYAEISLQTLHSALTHWEQGTLLCMRHKVLHHYAGEGTHKQPAITVLFTHPQGTGHTALPAPQSTAPLESPALAPYTCDCAGLQAWPLCQHRYPTAVHLHQWSTSCVVSNSQQRRKRQQQILICLKACKGAMQALLGMLQVAFMLSKNIDTYQGNT
jgi:hypothetical protein